MHLVSQESHLNCSNVDIKQDGLRKPKVPQMNYVRLRISCKRWTEKNRNSEEYAAYVWSHTSTVQEL